MVNGVENDSFRIGKMKCGLASYADLALGTATFGALIKSAVLSEFESLT